MQGLQAVREVRQWYAESFQDIRNSPRPETKECEREFVRTLMQVGWVKWPGGSWKGGRAGRR
jgi:hypothetical protein